MSRKPGWCPSCSYATSKMGEVFGEACDPAATDVHTPPLLECRVGPVAFDHCLLAAGEEVFTGGHIGCDLAGRGPVDGGGEGGFLRVGSATRLAEGRQALVELEPEGVELVETAPGTGELGLYDLLGGALIGRSVGPGLCIRLVRLVDS